jgi:hypothetical protein
MAKMEDKETTITVSAELVKRTEAALKLHGDESVMLDRVRMVLNRYRMLIIDNQAFEREKGT